MTSSYEGNCRLTANAIRFDNSWFNASGQDDYSSLNGDPGGYAFTMRQPGAIVNQGNLAVGQGENLSLVAGSVASTGQLAATGGEVLVSSVPGESYVRLSKPGQMLSFDIQPLSTVPSQPNGWNMPDVSLADLVTGNSQDIGTTLTVKDNGAVVIAGSEVPIAAGDVAVKSVESRSAVLASAKDLALVESQLQTAGDLSLVAQDTVTIRDSVDTAFLAKSGGNLTIQGNNKIDILALNHPESTPFQSGADLSLMSNGIISGDAHFQSAGNLSFSDLNGNSGTFISLFDPIIKSGGDVNLGGSIPLWQKHIQ